MRSVATGVAAVADVALSAGAFVLLVAEVGAEVGEEVSFLAGALPFMKTECQAATWFAAIEGADAGGGAVVGGSAIPAPAPS